MSTLTAKKRTCSQKGLYFATRHIFQTPSAVATASHVGCHQPVAEAGSRAMCPQEAGHGTKK